MKSPRDYCQVILDEVARLRQNPPTEDVWHQARVLTGSLPSSARLEGAITALAKSLLDQRPDAKDLHLRFGNKGWRNIVKSALTAAFVEETRPVTPHNSDALLTAVVSRCEDHRATLIPRTFAFACSLFNMPLFQPFTLGPVLFETRVDWLSRMAHEGTISKITLRRVNKTWASPNAKSPLRGRKASLDSASERGILEDFKNCTTVCCVSTGSLDADTARIKALTASRLAMTGIALLWQEPSSVLRSINLWHDRPFHHRRWLAVAAGKAILTRSELRQFWLGAFIPPEEWDKRTELYQGHFAVLAEVLEFSVADSDAAAKRPRMLNTLLHALLWFHEACREENPALAVVKHAASLDALAGGGGKAAKITQLVTARLGFADDQSPWEEGPTLKSAVEEIYNQGRSRTIHGTNDKIRHDWAETRQMAESLGRICLLACFDWASKHLGCDDPKKLLA